MYLVFNTIGNLTTQDQQVACFANAAAHLEPGGCFVIEVGVPDLRRLPPGEDARVFSHAPGYVGYDRYTDLVAQQADVAPLLRRRVGDPRAHDAVPVRVALRARPHGGARRPDAADRWADWDRSPFTGESTSHVSVWEKTDPSDR